MLMSFHVDPYINSINNVRNYEVKADALKRFHMIPATVVSGA